MAAPVRRKVRFGVIVPSSNTVLEPVTQQIVASLASDTVDVTVHFSRFRVTKIEISPESNAQFTQDAMLEAAQLLADAHVDVIGWSGTSASWLGIATDEALCRSIAQATGIPATSSVLAMNDILRCRPTGADIGLVTPYTPDLNAAIQRTYAGMGMIIADGQSCCAGLSENVAFADLDEPQLDRMVEEVVQHGAKTVMIMCTNVRAAGRAKHWESVHGIQVLDSVATVVVGMLKTLVVEVDASEQWGSVLSK